MSFFQRRCEETDCYCETHPENAGAELKVTDNFKECETILCEVAIENNSDIKKRCSFCHHWMIGGGFKVNFDDFDEEICRFCLDEDDLYDFFTKHPCQISLFPDSKEEPHDITDSNAGLLFDCSICGTKHFPSDAEEDFFITVKESKDKDGSVYLFEEKKCLKLFWRIRELPKYRLLSNYLKGLYPFLVEKFNIKK